MKIKTKEEVLKRIHIISQRTYCYPYEKDRPDLLEILKFLAEDNTSGGSNQFDLESVLQGISDGAKQSLKDIVGIDNINLSTKLDKGSYNGTAEDLNKLIENINLLLTSDDETLNELQEIVSYIKQNKHILDSLNVSNISGLDTALGNKLETDLSNLGDDGKEKLKGIISEFFPIVDEEVEGTASGDAFD